MSGVKRVLRALRLDKIAGVDHPCQEPASADILKRADAEAIWKAKYDTDQRREMADNGEAMSDGSYPIKDGADLENAIHAVGRGRNNSHGAIRQHIMSRAKSLGLEDKIPDDWSAGGKMAKALFDALRKGGLSISESDEDEGAETFMEALSDQTLTAEFWQTYYQGTQALEGSLLSILKDESVEDKAPLVTQTLQQFADYLEQMMPGSIGESLAAGVAASAGTAGAPTLSKGDPMSDELKKALGLSASVSEADVLKAIAHNVAVAKMSDKHKAFMDHADAKMPLGGKEAFAAMSGDERDSHMKAHPLKADDGDEDDKVAKSLRAGTAFRTPDGDVIFKSDVGDATFALLKSQSARLTEMGSELAKSRDREENASFAKRATDIGCEAEFGTTLRKAYGGDAAAQGEVEKRIKALTAQVDTGELFKSFGGSGTGEGTATAEFLGKVEAIKKDNPRLSDAQAYTRVYDDRANRTLVKRYLAEQAEANG